MPIYLNSITEIHSINSSLLLNLLATEQIESCEKSMKITLYDSRALLNMQSLHSINNV